MEVLSESLGLLSDEDFIMPSKEISIMVMHFIAKIRERVAVRLENRQTNKRKFKLSFSPPEIAAMRLAFIRVEYSSTPEAVLLRGVLMELDRHI